MKFIVDKTGDEGARQQRHREDRGEDVLTVMGLLDFVLYAVAGTYFIGRVIVHVLTCHF